MFQRNLPSFGSKILLATVVSLGVSFLGGCGVGAMSEGALAGPDSPSTGNLTMGGILHGGPNPITGAKITLYTTTTGGYGAAATVVATTTTDSSGFFSLTLPTATVACPAGQYAYIGAYGGSTGSNGVNANSLLMVPIGACSSNYTSTGTGPYVNTYTGSNLWIDEMTTAVSAYALGNFMTVASGCTTTCAINIGTKPNNLATACYALSSPSAACTAGNFPSAAGLAHAFANALALINISTGQPNAYMYSTSSGGVIPQAELYLLGNILQACVNSSGVNPSGTNGGMNSGTANDSSGCGKLFSYTTPPASVSGTSTPDNTMQAMLNLAKYPNPNITGLTWNSGCTATGTGGSYTATTTSCLFGLAASSGAYAGALTSAPPDWALAVVYPWSYGNAAGTCTAGACTVNSITLGAGGSGYTSVPTVTFTAPSTGVTATGTAIVSGGVVTGVSVSEPGTGYSAAPTISFSGGGGTGASATATIGNPGLNYPFYVALDYQDNVYVLNYDSYTAGTLPQAAASWTSLLGFGNNGQPLFTRPIDTSHLAISIIGTDLATHVFGANAANTNPAPVLVYSTSSGNLLTTVNYNNNEPLAVAADPFNNIYVTSYLETVNLRKLTYGGTASAPTYTVVSPYSAISIITSGSAYQIAFDSNLDLYEFLDPSYNGGSGSPYACLLTNQSSSAYTYMSAAPPAYTNCTTGGSTAVAIPGNTGSNVVAAGIGATSTGALAIGSNGMTKITKTGSTSAATIAATSTTTIPAVNTSLFSRYVSVDGNNWGYSVDGAGGSVASGIAVFDATDSVALGTYKGCFVTGTACGTGVPVGGGPGQAAMYSPRAAAIDSSGDIWVVSGNAADLTELIGVAAPTWPGLSMAKFGLPQ